MRPTLENIEEKFDHYNQLCFDGQLPHVPICLNMRRASMGLTVYSRFQSDEGLKERIHIEISVRFDLLEEEYISILVHEMIHLYIIVNHLEDDSPHGHIFISKMNELNERFKLNLSVRFDPDEEMRVKTIDRWRYICVLDFEDDKMGVAVIARNKLFGFWSVMPSFPNVRTATWYASNRLIFASFPVFVRPGYCEVDADKLCHYLTGAVELENTGDAIQQKQ